MRTMDHSPEAYLSHHTSMVRNTYSTASLALAILGFASVFSDKDHDVAHVIVVVLGVALFFFTAAYGIKGSVDFETYLDRTGRRGDVPAMYRLEFPKWRQYCYFNYAFIALVAALAILYSMLKMRWKLAP